MGTRLSEKEQKLLIIKYIYRFLYDVFTSIISKVIQMIQGTIIPLISGGGGGGGTTSQTGTTNRRPHQE